MSDLATYSRTGSIGTIVMDDGKANVMSLAMLNALHAAFDQAEKDKTVVILKARGKHFSGGFDLNVFAKGSAEDQYLMLKAGAELALRILSFPTPVGLPGQFLSDGGVPDHVERPPHRRRGQLQNRHERDRDRADGAAVCDRDRPPAAETGLFQPGGDDGRNVRTGGGRYRRLLRPRGGGGRTGAQRTRRPRSSARSTWRPMPAPKRGRAAPSSR